MNFKEIYNNKIVVITTSVVRPSGNTQQFNSTLNYYIGTILEDDNDFIKLLELESKNPKYINRQYILCIDEYVS